MKRTKACTIWWAGVAASSAAFLISVVGISNTIGRVISGAFTDLPFVRWSLWLFTHAQDQNVHTAPWWWQPFPWPWEQPALHSWPSVRPTGILTFILWVSKLDQDNDFDSKVFCRCVCHVWLLPLRLVCFSHRFHVLILDFYNDIMIHLYDSYEKIWSLPPEVRGDPSRLGRDPWRWPAHLRLWHAHLCQRSRCSHRLVIMVMIMILWSPTCWKYFFR